jgi:hypothetical protein
VQHAYTIYWPTKKLQIDAYIDAYGDYGSNGIGLQLARRLSAAQLDG